MHYLAQLLQSETAPQITCKNFPPACFTNLSEVGKIALPLMYTIATVMVLLYGFFGAWRYIGAADDAKAMEQARQTISYAILGLFIIFLAYFITRVVTTLFKIDFLI